MSLLLKVMKADGRDMEEPYLLRTPGWSEERYFREAPETHIVEYEDGEIIMHSPANIRHQDIAAFATFLIHGFVQSQKLGRVFNGPAVVRLRPGLDYEPDIFFVAVDQSNNLTEEFFSGGPALVVEVISPGSRNHDMKTKAAGYREHGVPEYWAIDYEQRTFYHHLLRMDSNSPYLVTRYTEGRVMSQSIPGFWIDVGWLWQEPLPVGLTCLQSILA